METNISDIITSLSLNSTIYGFVLHADPVVKAVMALLVLVSVICWAIIFEKAIRLSGFGAQVRRLEWFAAAPTSAPDRRNWLAASLYATAIDQDDPLPQESRADLEARIEKAMRLTARATLNRLQPRLRFLATVGSTAPFVGLLGTVWGIMNSFTAIAAQKDTSLAVVAPGIAEALFATALGLVAAIPAVVAYNQLTGSISRSAERINFAIALIAASFLRGMAKQRRER